MCREPAVTRAPELPGGLPWLGHAVEFRRDPIALLKRGRAQFGDVFAFRLAGARITALTGPAAQAAFFQAPDDQLSAREVYQFMVPVFGKGVAYDAVPEVMDEQMGLFLPALRDERLQSYARVMQEEVEDYCRRWGASGEIDLLRAMNELTIFIAGRCLVGDAFRQSLSEEFAGLYRDLEGGINLAAFMNPYLPLPSLRRRDRARRRVGELIGCVIRDRRTGAAGGEDFLQTLLDARYSDGAALDDEVIAGLLLAIVFAGQHTSAVLGTWTGLLLLQHPEHLARLRDEQASVFGGAPDVSLRALGRLELLERCIKEAERMHPPLVVLMRKVLRDFAYGAYVVPAGELALVSPGLSHRLPEVFRDADRYDPDRFGPGRQEDRAAKYSLIAFGGGRHRCIGSTFAYQQIKVIWSILLQRFDWVVDGAQPVPDYSTFVVGPRPPTRVLYRRRETGRASLVAVSTGVGT
jgi:sterol 14-demethylase